MGTVAMELLDKEEMEKAKDSVQDSVASLLNHPHHHPEWENRRLAAEAFFLQDQSTRSLDDLTEEELETELIHHFRRLQTPKRSGPPEVDFGVFQAFHDKFADMIDPDGVHPARIHPEGPGRKLGVYTDIIKDISSEAFGVIYSESFDALTDQLGEDVSTKVKGYTLGNILHGGKGEKAKFVFCTTISSQYHPRLPQTELATSSEQKRIDASNHVFSFQPE